MTPISHILSDFVFRASWTDFPDNVRTEAVRAFVNYTGCALGGSNTVIVEAALRGIAGLIDCDTVRRL